MIRTPPPRADRGLTFIELVLTLSILAIAGALVSGALTAGLRAWQTGFVSGREDLIARIVIERISAQLRSAVSSPARRAGAGAVAFDAREGELRFVTLSGSGSAPTQVSYTLVEGADGKRLVYREYPWPDKDFFGEHAPRREESVPEVAGFAVSVTPRPEEDEGPNPPPGRTWSPTDGVLPEKVAVDLQLKASGGAEPRTYRIEVALPTEASP